MQKFNYLKLTDKLNYPYIRVPRELIYGEKYSGVSAYAKFLYMAMLERMSLSQKNGWIDSDGNIFIYLTCKDAMEILGCSEGKVLKHFAELEDIGLIKRKRQGLCRPDIIYPSYYFRAGNDDVISDNNTCKTNEPEPHNDMDLNCKNKSSDALQTKEPEPQDLKTNNINNNKNKINKNNNNYHILPVNPDKWIEERMEYIDIVKSNIDYDVLIGECRKDIIDEIVNSIVNILCSSKELIFISGEYIPREEVKRRFLSLDQSHIEFIYDSLKKNKTDVKNMHAYLLTTLYRASDCISLSYQSIVNHDFAERKKVF